MLIVPCALIVRDGRLLATLRHSDKEQGDKWESPGGKADSGETEEQALVREVAEELGVRVAVRSKVCAVDVHPPTLRRAARMVFYHCDIEPGQPEPRPLAASALGWFTPDEFLSLDLCVANSLCRHEIARFVASALTPTRR